MDRSMSERYGLTLSDAPYRAGGRIPIYVATPGHDVDVLVTGNGILGVQMHYAEGRTRPCLALTGYCQWCDQVGLPDRWRGFLVCYDYRRGRDVLAELSAEAVSQCLDFRRLSGRLRGQRLVLRRQGSARNARMSAALSDAGVPAERIPPAFDGMSALARIWNLAEVRESGVDGSESDPATEGL